MPQKSKILQQKYWEALADIIFLYCIVFCVQQLTSVTFTWQYGNQSQEFIKNVKVFTDNNTHLQQ